MTDADTQDDVFDVFDHQPDAGPETDQINDGDDDQAEGDPSEEDEGDEGSPSDTEDDHEEVERGGKKYRVHKDLKGDLLRQDDYSRKTQVHAEQVRRFEERVKSFEALTEDGVKAAAEAMSLRERLADIQSLTDADWAQVRAMDRQDGGDRYDRLMRDLSALPGKLAEAEKTSQAKRDEALKAQSDLQTKRIEQGRAVLERDIPGWGPELGSKLAAFAAKEFGVNPEEDGEAFMSPKVVKMVHALWQAKEVQRKTQTQQRAEKAQTQTPPKTVRAGAAPKTGLHDGLSAKEWADRRNRQLAAKGRR